MKDKLTGINERDGKRYNCGESTVLMINDKHTLPGFGADAMRALSHTGAGVSCCGTACGAVVGMATALGLVYGTDGSEDIDDFNEKRGVNMMKTRAIVNEFKDKFGSVNCNDLTGIDLSTDEGMANWPKYVADMKEKTDGIHPCDVYLDWAAERVLKTLKG
jgi:C_GCAxxG_C_C family probable redox protein